MNTLSLDQPRLNEITSKLERLSGDLDLPLEETISQDPPTVLRISSNTCSAYSVYYVDDAARFASLVLSGTDHDTEVEMMQVFKYLLLDESDDDEPDEDAINEVLGENLFQFDQHDERPIVYQIRLSDLPEHDDLSLTLSDLDFYVATAFLNHPLVNSTE